MVTRYTTPGRADIRSIGIMIYSRSDTPQIIPLIILPHISLHQK